MDEVERDSSLDRLKQVLNAIENLSDGFDDETDDAEDGVENEIGLKKDTDSEVSFHHYYAG